MKKILRLTSILAIIIFVALIGNVYAASLNCDLAITTQKNDYSKGEEFIANVYLSNINSDQGIIAFQATLQYDTQNLTLIEMNGKNAWDTPSDGTSYNKDNGKLVLTSNKLVKENQDVFEIKFKINDNSASKASITLKDVKVTTGDATKDFATISKEINVTNSSSGNQGGNNNQGNNNQNNNNNQGNNQNNNNNQGSNNQSNQNTHNGGNTKPNPSLDRTNITGQNNKNNTTTSDDSTTNNTNDSEEQNNSSAVSTTNTDINTEMNTTTNTIGSTSKTNTIKSDGEIPKTGITSVSFWLIIFIIAVFCIALFFYGRLMAFDKKTEDLQNR